MAELDQPGVFSLYLPGDNAAVQAMVEDDRLLISFTVLKGQPEAVPPPAWVGHSWN